MGNNITVAPWIYFTPPPTPSSTPIVQPPLEKTRLGLVGETLIGPAFQPVLLRTANEFSKMFGGLSDVTDGITNFPRYELPYVANQYLAEAKHVYVTRVLGLCGYNAGHTWGITINSDYNTTTLGPTITAGTYSTLFSFTADSQNTVTNIVSNDSLLQTLWDNNLFGNTFNNLPSQLSGATNGSFTGGSLNQVFQNVYPLGSSFTGLSITNYYLNSYVYDIVNDIYVGTTSGVTTYYSASTYDSINDQIVVLLKSKATYDGDENLKFNLSGGTTSLSFDTTVSGATNNIYGNFKLQWTTTYGSSGSVLLNLDRTSPNYIGTILDKNNPTSTYPIYVDEIYDNNIRNFDLTSKVKGVNLSLVNYSNKFSNYKDKFKPSVTPWVVSQLRGSNMTKLFRFWSKGDGEYTSNLFKATISNIRLTNNLNTGYTTDFPDDYDDYKFDVTIRPIDNPDTSFQGFVDEVYQKCSMNPKSASYIGKMIGTRNGDYPSRSNNVFVEINPDEDVNLLNFPAGFLGYPIIDYSATTSGVAKAPEQLYKLQYKPTDNVAVTYLGLSDAFGYDKSLFKYNGKPISTTINEWTAVTKGFHMDINASGSTVDDLNYTVFNYEFEVGDSPLTDEQLVVGTSYEFLNSRKFTLMPYGGFDGWDMHRKGKTNSSRYRLTGDKGILGEIKDNFDKISLTDKTTGLNSDYYAFLEGLWTFKTDFIDINLFATPGLDVINHNDLIEEAIDLIEYQRGDSLYIVNTPDVNSADDKLNVEDIVNFTDGLFNTSYAATYWPWVQLIQDGIFLPPTGTVIASIARNDKAPNGQLWFAAAGVTRGAINIFDLRRNELNQLLSKPEVDYLYNNRINPLIYVVLQNYDGYKIWGNKTLLDDNKLTNRIHVRRLLLEARYIIKEACKKYLFEQNDIKTQRLLENAINPLLASIKDGRGISQFKLEFDRDPDKIDRGQLDGKIFLKPINTIEYMVFSFSIIPRPEDLQIIFNQD